MVWVLTGLSIYWIVGAGYIAALIMSRMVPPVFVGIAFDSGGVASGSHDIHIFTASGHGSLYGAGWKCGHRCVLALWHWLP